MFAIAERLVVGEATATQRNGVPTGQAEFFARGITNRHIAFDTQGTIIVNRDHCHRSNVALGHAHPARQLKPPIAPYLSLVSLLAPDQLPSQRYQQPGHPSPSASSRARNSGGVASRSGLAIDASDNRLTPPPPDESATAKRPRSATRCRFLRSDAGQPAIAESRLRLMPDGRVTYSLRNSWRDDTAQVVLTGRVLIERLLVVCDRLGFKNYWVWWDRSEARVSAPVYT